MNRVGTGSLPVRRTDDPAGRPYLQNLATFI